MILKNDYYYYSQALSNQFCDQVIQTGTSIHLSQARTGGVSDKDLTDKKKLKHLKKIRNSFVSFLDDLWIHRKLKGFLLDANQQAEWNFDVTKTEKMQFTKYGLKEFYGWHRDGFYKKYDNPKAPELIGTIRKLSMVVQLSEPSDYTGGELEFSFPEPNKKLKIMTIPEFKAKGSIVVFPGFIWHRVKPVLSGTRYSLVTWTVGAPYK